MEGLSLFIFLIAGLVLMAGVFFLFRYISGTAGKQWTRHKAETVDQWAASGVTFTRGPIGSKFAGLESMGVAGVLRGIGYAAITSEDLRLTRSVPSAAWCVPFAQIRQVSIQPTFLGQRSKKTPFIVVSFEEDGRADKVGFQVTDAEQWAQDLAQAAHVDLERRLPYDT